MSQVNNVHIWYPSGYPGPAWNLYQVQDWAPDANNATLVRVRFVGLEEATVTFDKTAFETAYAAHLTG